MDLQNLACFLIDSHQFANYAQECDMRRIPKALLLTPILILFSVPAWPATIYVNPSGTNQAGCGTSPRCKTIEYACEEIADIGDTVSVDDGTYVENQIDLPVGVSLTSTNSNRALVIVNPSANGITQLKLSSSGQPIQTTAQSVSNITWDGTATYSAQDGIHIVNRCNVTIDDCVIKEYKQDRSWAIKAYSEYCDASDNCAGGAWDRTPWSSANITIHTWDDFEFPPANAIENLTITDSIFESNGYNTQANDWAPTGGAHIGIFHAKAGTINNNIFRGEAGHPVGKRDTHARHITGLGGDEALLQDFTIHSNQFLGEYVIGLPIVQYSKYLIEIWMTWNLKVYRNYFRNGGSSINGTDGFEFYENKGEHITPVTDYKNPFLEGLGANGIRVRHNKAVGYGGACLQFGYQQQSAPAGDNKVWGNTCHDTYGSGIGVKWDDGDTVTFDIFNNTVDASGRNGSGVGIGCEFKGKANGGRLNINIKNNSITNSAGYAGEYRNNTEFTPAALNSDIHNNGTFNNGGGWKNITATHTINIATGPGPYLNQANDNFALNDESPGGADFKSGLDCGDGSVHRLLLSDATWRVGENVATGNPDILGWTIGAYVYDYQTTKFSAPGNLRINIQ
jgi:hypothetical protein